MALSPLAPNAKKDVRNKIAAYCLAAEKNQVVWNYSQQRPFNGFGVPPQQHHVNDCSGYVSLAFNWAMHETGIYIADPLGYRYSGWGNTGSEYEFLKKYPTPDDKYLIGDMVIYGSKWNTVHTSICRVAGDRKTAIFSSNGNERAPQPTKIDYHPDPVLGVFRHPQLR